METTVKLESIRITIGKKELVLSVEAARKLHDELAKLFAEKPERVVRHVHSPWYWQVPITSVGYGVTYTNTADATPEGLTINGTSMLNNIS